MGVVACAATCAVLFLHAGATHAEEINPQIDLAVEIAASADTVGPGDRVEYQLTVSNAGPFAAAVVTVVDVLPNGLVFESAPGCTVSSNMVECPAGVLFAGAVATFTVVAVVAESASGSLVNTASVENREDPATGPVDTDLDNNTDSATVVVEHGPSLLRLVKEVLNDDGGTAAPQAWVLSATATSGDASLDISYAGDAGEFREVFAGVGYGLSESVVAGYTSTDGWRCDGGTLVGSVVTLSAGDRVTCTIVGDDDPDEAPPDEASGGGSGGGQGGGSGTGSGIGNGGGSGTENDGGPGDVPGNEPGDGRDDEPRHPGKEDPDGGDLDGGGPDGDVPDGGDHGGGGPGGDVPDGDDSGNEPTNEPALRLIKHVVNDDGGGATPGMWEVSARSAGGDASRDFSYGGDVGEFREVFAGLGYQLSESVVDGYTTSDGWRCDGGTLAGSLVTLSDGDRVTCTITSDDVRRGSFCWLCVLVPPPVAAAALWFAFPPPWRRGRPVLAVTLGEGLLATAAEVKITPHVPGHDGSDRRWREYDS